MNKKLSWCLGCIFMVAACSEQTPKNEQVWLDCYNHYRAQSYKVAQQECEAAANLGVVRAAWFLGHLYYYDLLQNGSSREQGFSWYLKAAQGGWPEALTYVGESYMYADGVAEDYSKAFEWLNKAAQLNDPDAEFAIGMLYYDGKGRSKDISTAIAWFKRAAEKSHLMSINNLAWIYATSAHQAFRDAEQALHWAERLEPSILSKHQDPSFFLDTKAAAYALADDFEQAIDLQNKAISLLPENVAENRLLEFQQHLEAYQNNRPWLEEETPQHD